MTKFQQILFSIIVVGFSAFFYRPADAQPFNNGNWLGTLRLQSSNCVFTNGDSPHSSTSPILPSVTLDQTGASISLATPFATDPFPASLTGTVTSSGLATFDFNYSKGDSGVFGIGVASLCSGHVTFQLQGVTPLNLDNFYIGIGTYTITVQACDFSTAPAFPIPCTGVYSGRMTGPVNFPGGGAQPTLGARIGGYNLECTLKNGTTAVSGVSVTASKKVKGSEEFLNFPKAATTNTKGVAKFSLKKLKKGTKVKCTYGSVSSKEPTVPQLPKN